MNAKNTHENVYIGELIPIRSRCRRCHYRRYIPTTPENSTGTRINETARDQHRAAKVQIEEDIVWDIHFIPKNNITFNQVFRYVLSICN